MKFELTVTEFKEMFNTLQSSDELLELLRVDFSNQVGIYLSKLMKAELSEHLGREPYERSGNPANHRNGFYQRKITLKGIGEVEPRVPGIGKALIKLRCFRDPNDMSKLLQRT